MKLVHKLSKSAAVRGDKVMSFRGEDFVLTGWKEPQHLGSTGRVYVKELGGKFEKDFFPSVFDLEFIEESNHGGA